MEYLREGIPLGHLNRLHFLAHKRAKHPNRFDRYRAAARRFSQLYPFEVEPWVQDKLNEPVALPKPPQQPKQRPVDIPPPLEGPPPRIFKGRRPAPDPSPAAMPEYAGELE